MLHVGGGRRRRDEGFRSVSSRRSENGGRGGRGASVDGRGRPFGTAVVGRSERRSVVNTQKTSRAGKK